MPEGDTIFRTATQLRAALVGKTAAPALELQSRGGALSPADELALERFLA